MKIITDINYTFSFVPLIHPQNPDVLTIDLRNEISNLAITENCNWSDNLGRVYITIPSPQLDFEIGNKYSIVVKNGTDAIYYGKLTVLENGTDIQNFEYGNKYYSE